MSNLCTSSSEGDLSLHFHRFIIFFFNSIVCVLILLVLGDEVIHIGLSLSKLHLIHALLCVPVEPGLAPVHRGELFTNTLEDLLDGRGVA